MHQPPTDEENFAATEESHLIEGNDDEIVKKLSKLKQYTITYLGQLNTNNYLPLILIAILAYASPSSAEDLAKFSGKYLFNLLPLISPIISLPFGILEKLIRGEITEDQVHTLVPGFKPLFVAEATATGTLSFLMQITQSLINDFDPNSKASEIANHAMSLLLISYFGSAFVGIRLANAPSDLKWLAGRVGGLFSWASSGISSCVEGATARLGFGCTE